MCDVTGFMAEPVKEITTEIVDKAEKRKRRGVEVFKIRILEKFRCS